jgi:CDP-glucose 4,6-dehydratase
MKSLSFYNGKKVFITGHTGFTGTWLCHILLESGSEVTGYGLEAPKTPSLYVKTGLDKYIHSITGDIRNRDKVVKAVTDAKPDIVFHLAAQPLVGLSYREPALTYDINVMGTVNILEALRLTASVRSIVNVTTDKVYENKEWCWGYRENENLCGLDPYSNSKSCSELVTFSYRKSFFKDENSVIISTARSGNVIGGGDYAEGRIVTDCVQAALERREIVLRNPYPIRPYLHVLDCLWGYLLLAEKQYTDRSFAGEYNFGPKDENCVTVGTLAELFCETWGQGIRWKIEDNKKTFREANFLKLDSSKAKLLLGWEPGLDIRSAIKEVIEFEKCITDEEKLSCLKNQIKMYFSDLDADALCREPGKASLF